MNIHYMRITEKMEIVGLNSTQHISWSDARNNFFAPREKTDELPIWLMDTADARHYECVNTQMKAGAKSINLYLDEIKKWLIIPVRPSKIIRAMLIKDYKPVRVYITRCIRGVRSVKNWYVAVLMRPAFHMEKSKNNLFSFCNNKISFRPKSITDPTFVDADNIEKIARLCMLGKTGIPTSQAKPLSKNLLRPVVDGPLPLPAGAPVVPVSEDDVESI